LAYAEGPFVFAIRRHPSGSFWRQIQQGTDGPGGSLTGPELQHLSEQDQHDDHGGCLEVNRDHRMLVAKIGREHAGQRPRITLLHSG